MDLGFLVVLVIDLAFWVAPLVGFGLVAVVFGLFVVPLGLPLS